MQRAHSNRPLVLPAALGVAGLVALVVAVGRPEALWLVLPWSVVGLVVAGLWRRVVLGRAARVAVAIVLVIALVVLTFEGGLFFVPAAVALLVVSALRC